MDPKITKLPRVSVITVSFNIEEFVERTILSVIDQKRYVDFEYIVVDGGSTDKTMSIIERYRDQIDIIVSEKDDGQYFAIAKGMQLAKGDILCWINADDILMPWTVSQVQTIFAQFPEVDWITGSPSFLNQSGHLTQVHSKLPAYPLRFIKNGWYQKGLAGYLQQENMFWRRTLWEECGGLNTKYKLAADFDLWKRFADVSELVAIDVPLAAFRERIGEQRSSKLADAYQKEVAEICKLAPAPPLIWSLLCSTGAIGVSVAQMLIFRRTPGIYFSRRQSRWKMVRNLRSIARIDFSRLIVERLLRR